MIFNIIKKLSFELFKMAKFFFKKRSNHSKKSLIIRAKQKKKKLILPTLKHIILCFIFKLTNRMYSGNIKLFYSLFLPPLLSLSLSLFCPPFFSLSICTPASSVKSKGHIVVKLLCNKYESSETFRLSLSLPRPLSFFPSKSRRELFLFNLLKHLKLTFQRSAVNDVFYRVTSKFPGCFLLRNLKVGKSRSCWKLTKALFWFSNCFWTFFIVFEL